ncbi:MAG: PcfJ domain-containing protein, partial [Alphaproteobacteria bacterium]|nr:PcfJ domain-containing protein [Alphaproteobacteria bacterium]
MSEIINLVDVKPVLNYLERVCFMHENRERRDDFMMQPQTTAQKLKDKQFVADNKEYLIRSICFGWFKSKFIKTYFTDERIKNCKFITSVTTNDKNAPKWLKAGDVAYVFDETKIPDGVKNELTEIRDYLYNVANAYITKELIKNKTGVKLDALSANRNIGTYDLAITESKKWHSKIKQQKIDLEKTIKDTCIVHDFKNGMKFRQLLTPDALDAESKMMGHCVGDGGYDEGVKKGTTQIYSLRDENEEAHATLEVKAGKVYQCKGKGNKAPIAKYVPYIQKFIEKTKFEPVGDLGKMGLIKDDKNGKLYSIYNFPSNVEFYEVCLSGADGIEISEGLKCKKLDLS